METFGAWLSLVERLVRDQEAGGSNPLAPTNPFSNLQRVARLRPHHTLLNTLPGVFR